MDPSKKGKSLRTEHFIMPYTRLYSFSSKGIRRNKAPSWVAPLLDRCNREDSNYGQYEDEEDEENHSDRFVLYVKREGTVETLCS